MPGPRADRARAGLAAQIFPFLFEKGQAPFRAHAPLVISDFLTGFQVGYLILRDEGKETPITEAVAAKMGMDAPAIHGAAIANLTKDCGSAIFKLFDSPEGAVLLFDAEGGMHSSRLILPTLYRWLIKFMRGPFVVGIPNRDVMICVAESNRTALDGLTDDLDASYRTRRHPLTLKMFRITADGVALLG